ncbi:fatty acid alpha-hydroxylase [Komagataella kurtzmanii]|nr:fatty acid alpha-hydroxylase [Komagataella kurtzmanii]
MNSNRPLPLFASADVQKHVSPKDCWVTLYHRKVYNVTEFLEEHPAGDDLILEYAGKDITQIMGDQLSHIHSESAYEMLDEDMLVGYLATPEEERELLSNKDHEVEVQLDSKGNVVEVDIDLTEFGELPAEGLLSLKTDYEHDLVKHQFLDLNRPLLMQVLRGSWTKEFYLDQVHRPRHYGKGSAPLFGNFLEPLSMTAWWVVPMVWLPVNFYFFYIGFTNQNKLVAMAFWLLGLFVWTFLEYALHRFLFHLDYYLPENQIAFTIHFLLHGIHHYLPMDKYRLVMPPTLFIVLCYPIKTLVFSVLPYYMACSGFAGGFLGYIMYDVTHYVLHHSKLPRYFQELKKYHLEHHYKNYELGFGVTSKFWDKVFGTYLGPDDVYQKTN